VPIPVPGPGRDGPGLTRALAALFAAGALTDLTPFLGRVSPSRLATSGWGGTRSFGKLPGQDLSLVPVGPERHA
jgi:hypothetical protein